MAALIKVPSCCILGAPFRSLHASVQVFLCSVSAKPSIHPRTMLI